MKTQRMKLDYNHLLETIDAVMSNSRSKIARENGFGIGIGLNMLTSYIKQIAERAIEINDEILLGLLQDMMVIKEIDHPTEKGRIQMNKNLKNVIYNAIGSLIGSTLGILVAVLFLWLIGG